MQEWDKSKKKRKKIDLSDDKTSVDGWLDYCDRLKHTRSLSKK